MSQQALFKTDVRLPSTNGQTTNRLSDGIFGWYHYIQDFTGQFAIDWLSRISRPDDIIWEPFSGSGTTLVASKLMGLESHGYDISPFMVDVAKAKVDWTIDPDEIETGLEWVLLRTPHVEGFLVPELTRWEDYEDAVTGITKVQSNDPKLRKWIAPAVVNRFSRLLAAINSVEHIKVRRLLRLAAASILVPASNMVFRPNISYQKRPYLDYPVEAIFEERARSMISDYREVHSLGSNTLTHIEIGDARYSGPASASLIFTSPPYPNDMEYVHQTRLELVLLKYVHDVKGLTELKRQMISSSVKLVYRTNEWQKTHGLEIAGVSKVSKAIAVTLEGKNWGWNAADMIAHYYGGMRVVLSNWASRLKAGGRAAVVIGDSAFNGVKVPSDLLLAECARMEGFLVDGLETLRSRWNNKHAIELRESIVLLRK